MTIKKKISILVCSLFLAICLCFGIGLSTTNVRAEAPTSLSSFTMEKGCAVKIVDNVAQSGMKFQMKMSKADYDSLASYDVKFGMVVAPKNYVCDDAHDFTVANLFENGAIYYWNDNIISGKGTLSPAVHPVLNISLDNSNAEIWNITPSGEVKGDSVFFEVQLVNFASEAKYLASEYVCRGYVAITDNGNTTYIMANYFENARKNNTRSMAFVAQAEVDTLSLIPEENRTDVQTDTITTLQTGYITPAQGRQTTYDVECYSVNGNTLIETYTVESTMGADVNVTPKDIAGKVFDASNAGNLLSGKVGLRVTTFKAYYKDAPKLAVAPNIEVDCPSGTTNFDLTTRIKDTEDAFPTTYTVLDSSSNPVSITNNILPIANGESYKFTCDAGEVIIRGTNKGVGPYFAKGVDDSSLITITGDKFAYSVANANLVSEWDGGTKFTIKFNSDGLVPTTNARSLILTLYNGADVTKCDLEVTIEDLSGTNTFDKLIIEDIPTYTTAGLVIYMPAGMKLSDLKLSFKKTFYCPITITGFRIIENTAKNEINIANFDYASDYDSIVKSGFTNSNDGRLFQRYDTYKNTAQIRVPYLVMPNGEDYDGLNLSLDASTGNYDRTWTVTDGTTDYSFTNTDGEKTYVFSNIEQNILMSFVCKVTATGALDVYGEVKVDNIKFMLVRACDVHENFRYVNQGETHEKYCTDCDYLIETVAHNYVFNAEVGKYVCECGDEPSNIAGAYIKEAKEGIDFDLTTIKNIYGECPTAYTVLDSSKNVVTVTNNLLQVANGERYTFASTDGNVIIRGTNKGVGQIFAPGVDGYKGASEDAELITITDGHKITYNCLNEGVYSLIEIDGNNSSAKTSTIQFNTDGLISNENARSLVIKVSAYSGASANTLKIKAIDLTGTYSFAEQTYQSPAYARTNVTFVVYLPAGMNLSDLKLEFNRGSWFNVRLDGFRIIENTVENEINVANFDYETDYYSVATENFTELDPDTGKLTNDGKLNQRWNTYFNTAKIKVPYLIIPNGISYSSLSLSLDASSGNADWEEILWKAGYGDTEYSFNKTNGEINCVFNNVEQNSNVTFGCFKNGSPNTYGNVSVDNIKFVLNEINVKKSFNMTVDYVEGLNVLQITDTHISNQAECDAFFNDYCDKTIASINPDLIVITGDIITPDSKGTFDNFVARMDAYQIPWAPIFGNHDQEGALTKLQMSDGYESAEYCMYKRGNLISDGSVGNYVIKIKDGNIAKYNLFFFDCNGVSAITKDQVNWYKNEIRKSTAENGGVVVPSLVFTHIPIIEFVDAVKLYDENYSSKIDPYAVKGNNKTGVPGFSIDDEETGSSGLFHEGIGYAKSGIYGNLFDAIVELGSTKAIFCGHEHINYCDLVYNGVRFNYGLKSSLSGYYHEDHLGVKKITLNNAGFEINNVFFNDIPDA